MKHLIDRRTLGALFLRHWQETKDLDACMEVLEGAIDLRVRDAAFAVALRRPPQPAPARSDLALKTPAVRVVLEAVAEIAGLRAEDIVMRSRRPVIVRWRNICVWLLHQDGRSKSWVGRMFGSDHAFAVAGVRFAERILADDPALRARLLDVLPSEDRCAA